MQSACLPLIATVVLLSGVAEVLSADDGVALENEPLHQTIDRFIEQGFVQRQIKPTPLAADAEFLRRIYLDLTGTIPSASGVRHFLADPSPAKREAVIDRLLDSQAYAYHMQRQFDVMLLERQHANYITVDEWQKYLRTSFADDKPWDQFVGELLGTDGTDPEVRPALRFLLVRTIDSYRRLEPHMVAKDVGRLLFGQNLQCARCHDHPSIASYHQADYYGLFAYFQWSVVSTAKVGDESKFVIVEQPKKNTNYTSVFVADQPEQMALLQLPGSAAIPLPSLEEGKEYLVKPEEGKVPVPAFSPRSQLVSGLKDNVPFRKSIANRLWWMMFGRGIVDPIDLHHPDNPPSHPELLDALAERFAADGFRFKPFLKQLALSQTYQRSAFVEETTGAENLPPEAFAQAAIRPLSPEQFGVAVMQATGLADGQRAGLTDPADETPLLDFQAANLKAFIDLYGKPPGQAEHDYDSSLFQALFLANGGIVLDWIRPRPHSLATRLQEMTSDEQLADELFISVVSRQPTPEEIVDVQNFLQERTADRNEAIQELIWGTIATAEFRFNH
ncbi:MAG: DUF1549 domain-containing protein [Planctomycetota bacterium]|nr:DUF1549 domain-containing protein [Planctomycetota bacterium]MDA1213375.1 DUF1549 domain-containing protein [Planctomycetota bacterium]